MKGLDAEKMDRLVEELKDCELSGAEPLPGEVGKKEACVMEVLTSVLNKPEALKLLEEYLDEVEAWKKIRAPDSSTWPDESYALWLDNTEDPENATEITSQNGDYEVCEYASIVGLDFPKKLEERTPFLKTCTVVKAPNNRAAFVRGVKHLGEFGGEEEFVEEIPRAGD